MALETIFSPLHRSCVLNPRSTQPVSLLFSLVLRLVLHSPCFSTPQLLPILPISCLSILAASKLGACWKFSRWSSVPSSVFHVLTANLRWVEGFQDGKHGLLTWIEMELNSRLLPAAVWRWTRGASPGS